MIRIKSQISLEFLTLIGLALVILICALIIASSNLEMKQDEEEQIAVKDLAMMIQNELYLAAQVRDGYQREIMVPYKVNIWDYTINQTNISLSIQTSNVYYELAIPKIIGNISKGSNIIRNQGGNVTVS